MPGTRPDDAGVASALTEHSSPPGRSRGRRPHVVLAAAGHAEAALAGPADAAPALASPNWPLPGTACDAFERMEIAVARYGGLADLQDDAVRKSLQLVGPEVGVGGDQFCPPFRVIRIFEGEITHDSSPLRGRDRESYHRRVALRRSPGRRRPIAKI